MDKLNNVSNTDDNKKRNYNIVRKLSARVKDLESKKAEFLLFFIMGIAFTSTNIFAYVYTNIGINSYYLLLTAIGGGFSAIEFKHYLRAKKEFKVAKKQFDFGKEAIKEENILEKQTTNSKENTNTTKNINPNQLKRKLLIIKDYLLHQQEYQIYYNNNIIDWYLSNKYNKNDIAFLKELIIQDLSQKEEKNTKNKTKIK